MPYHFVTRVSGQKSAYSSSHGQTSVELAHVPMSPLHSGFSSSSPPTEFEPVCTLLGSPLEPLSPLEGSVVWSPPLPFEVEGSERAGPEADRFNFNCFY